MNIIQFDSLNSCSFSGILYWWDDDLFFLFLFLCTLSLSFSFYFSKTNANFTWYEIEIRVAVQCNHLSNVVSYDS